MRFLKWILAAAATATAAAYASDRIGMRRTDGRFRAALRKGAVTVTSHKTLEDKADGIEEERFHGVADGVAYLFTARTYARSGRTVFILTWTGEAVISRALGPVREALMRLPVVPRDAAP